MGSKIDRVAPIQNGLLSSIPGSALDPIFGSRPGPQETEGAPEIHRVLRDIRRQPPAGALKKKLPRTPTCFDQRGCPNKPSQLPSGTYIISIMLLFFWDGFPLEAKQERVEGVSYPSFCRWLWQGNFKLKFQPALESGLLPTELEARFFWLSNCGSFGFSSFHPEKGTQPQNAQSTRHQRDPTLRFAR